MTTGPGAKGMIMTTYKGIINDYRPPQKGQVTRLLTEVNLVPGSLIPQTVQMYLFASCKLGIASQAKNVELKRPTPRAVKSFVASSALSSQLRARSKTPAVQQSRGNWIFPTSMPLIDEILATTIFSGPLFRFSGQVQPSSCGLTW